MCTAPGALSPDPDRHLMTSRGPPMTFMLLMMGAASGAQALAVSPKVVASTHPHPCRRHTESVVCRARVGLHSEITHTGSGP